MPAKNKELSDTIGRNNKKKSRRITAAAPPCIFPAIKVSFIIRDAIG